MAKQEIETAIKKITNRYQWFTMFSAFMAVVFGVMLRADPVPWGWFAVVFIGAVVVGIIPLARAEALVRRELEKRENTND